MSGNDPAAVDEPSTKRVRYSNSPPINQSINQSVPPLFQYTFVRDVVSSMLDDVDVVTRLFITGKAVHTWYINQSTSQSRCYETKRGIDYEIAAAIVNHPLTPKLDIRRLTNVTSTDFAAFPHLKSIAFTAQHIPVNSIPRTVETIFISNDFDRPLDGILPPALTSLSLGTYNQPITPRVIPSTLVYLDLGQTFNQPLLAGTLPSSLKRLRFSQDFDQPLYAGVIPDGVHTILCEAFANFEQPLFPGMFPSSLRNLEFLMSNSEFLEAGVLPEGLEFMVLVVFPAPFKPGCFPNSLKTLLMHDDHDHKIPMGALPLNGNLKRIVMEHSIQQTFEPGFFPNGLVHLQLLRFNTPLKPGVLPPCLTHLDLGFAFNQVLVPGALPASLLHLVLGPSFNQPLMYGTIPQGVVKLSFGRDFNRRMPRGSIPSSVKYLLLYKSALFS